MTTAILRPFHLRSSNSPGFPPPPTHTNAGRPAPLPVPPRLRGYHTGGGLTQLPASAAAAAAGWAAAAATQALRLPFHQPGVCLRHPWLKCACWHSNTLGPIPHTDATGGRTAAAAAGAAVPPGAGPLRPGAECVAAARCACAYACMLVCMQWGAVGGCGPRGLSAMVVVLVAVVVVMVVGGVVRVG